MKIILGMSNPVLKSSLLGKVVPFLTFCNIGIYFGIYFGYFGFLTDFISNWSQYCQAWDASRSAIGATIMKNKITTIQSFSTVFGCFLWLTQQKYYVYLFKQLNNPSFIAYSVAYDETKDILCLLVGDTSTFYRNIFPKKLFISIQNASQIDFNLVEDVIIQGMYY